MAEGDTVVIPANALHSAIAITNVQILDVFTPVRADYQLCNKKFWEQIK